MSLLDNPIHLLILLIVVLLVLGPKRLPEVGRSLGSGMRSFRESLTAPSPPPPTPEAEGLGERVEANGR